MISNTHIEPVGNVSHDKIRFGVLAPMDNTESQTFCLPSIFVLRRRMINWKFDFSPLTSDILGNLIPRQGSFAELQLLLD
jgi:hypothetical protein